MPAINSNADAAAAEVTGKAYKIGAGNSMMLLVSRTGIKSWHLEFRIPGRTRSAIVLGRFPEVTYEQACILRQFALELLKAGKQPKDIKPLIWQLFHRKGEGMIPIYQNGKFSFLTGFTDEEKIDVSDFPILQDFSVLTPEEMEFAASCLKYAAYEKRLREELKIT